MADVADTQIPVDYQDQRNKINNAWNQSLTQYDAQRRNMLGQYGFDPNTSFGGKSFTELIANGTNLNDQFSKGVSIGTDPFGAYQQMIRSEGNTLHDAQLGNIHSGVGDYGIGAGRLDSLRTAQAGERQGFATDAMNNFSNLFGGVTGGYNDQQNSLHELGLAEAANNVDPTATELANQVTPATPPKPADTTNPTTGRPQNNIQANNDLQKSLSDLLSPSMSGGSVKTQIRKKIDQMLKANKATLDPKQVAKANAILKFYDKHGWDSAQVNNRVLQNIKTLQSHLASKDGKVNQKWVDKYLNSYMMNFGDFLDPKTKLKVQAALKHYKYK